MTFALLQQEVGNLGEHGFVHETDDTTLCLLHPAKPGNHPPEKDPRVHRQLGQNPGTIQPVRDHRRQGPGVGDVRPVPEHCHVSQHRSWTGDCKHPTALTLAAIDLDLSLVDEKGRVGMIALVEEANARAMLNDLGDSLHHLDIGGSQGSIVGSSERAGKPIEMLLVGLTHENFNRRATDILPYCPSLTGRQLSMPTGMGRHREKSNGLLWVLPSLAIPLVISATAWANHVSSEGIQIAPNVRFAGVDVSGLSTDLAAEQVDMREAAFLETPVTINLGERTVTMSAGELGYDYLYGDTLAAVVSARHGHGPWSEFVSWVSTPFETVTVEDRFVLDEEKARSRLSLDDLVLRFPVEPEIVSAEGQMTVVPGVRGVGIDADQVIADLAEADVASGAVEITAKRAPIRQDVNNRRARAVAKELNEMTREGLTAAIGSTAKRLPAGKVRKHLSAVVEEGEMTVSLDVNGFHQELEALFPNARGDLQKPVLEVVNGEVRVVEKGVTPPVCCTRDSVKTAAERFLNGGAPIYRLETRPNNDETMKAWADGSMVTEPVAEFTTYHACCENRVTNIHTMADAVRGHYMLPGETLSINEYVGPRTPEKGYLPAGAIRGGHLTDEVGGGISQFATTMFNAAFYGGLDLDSYQSHSVYFSRYPYGREATLSTPWPDLVLTNSTDYPVLIWPTYDDTSITVTLYSTEHIEVTETAPRITYINQCQHSEIDRQRTYPNGRVVVDTIEANYRPGDGLDCNGDPIPEPEN